MVVGSVTDERVAETSGLVHDGESLWLHNDSGDRARLLRIDGSGAVQEELALDAFPARDLEDMTARVVDGELELLVGDIGDNGRSHADLAVLVVRPSEPESARRIVWTYPDGVARDAETLLFDPVEGSVWLLTKSGSGESLMFSAPAEADVEVLERRGVLQLGEAPVEGDSFLTGGDVSPDGRWIALRTYLRVHIWERLDGQSLAEAMAGPPCSLVYDSEPQGEAIAWGPGGFFTLSEGRGQPLQRVSWPP